MKTMLIVGAVGLAAVFGFAMLQGREPKVMKVDEEGGIAGTEAGSPKRKDKVIKSDAEWQKILKPEQYRILRKKGTEAAFCGLFHDTKEEGTYFCAGCKLELFKSDAKFHSGTGWPSFFQPVSDKNIWVKSDFSYGMSRDEVMCARCDGHLGHVFPDGPKPTGKRFCINSDSLTFLKKKE
jgi:methionine-R-sulfoxide reductase